MNRTNDKKFEIEHNKTHDEARAMIFDVQRHARYVGRIGWSDPRGPILAWAGSSITVRFEGSVIAFKVIVVEREETWLDLIIDGGEPRTMEVGRTGGLFTAAVGLEDGPHTLEIYKRTEAMFGTIQFLGCELPAGGVFLSPPPHLNRKIEFIGDSISCGSGNEGVDGEANIAEHENNSLAYGTLTSKELEAEHHTVAVSGIGLVINYGDERVNTMPDQYVRLNPLQPEVHWDFTLWIPDVVVLNLGTNDSGYEVPKDEFIGTYVKFITLIRSHYPNAHIVMSLGPFQQAPLKDYLYTAVEILQAEGDERIHYLLFDKVDVDRDGMGETGHPNTITHARMAEQLTNEIKLIIGW